MTASKLTEAERALSTDAKLAAGSLFGSMRPGNDSHVTFHMRESRPTARTQAALDELVAAGMLSVEPCNDIGGKTYRPLVEFGRLLAWAFTHGGKGNGFRIAEPIAGRSALASAGGEVKP